MLRPLAISVIGALCISVALSLVATPTVYYLMYRLMHRGESRPRGERAAGVQQAVASP
jgi:Cu/Ag efflux pump CusA